MSLKKRAKLKSQPVFILTFLGSTVCNLRNTKTNSEKLCKPLPLDNMAHHHNFNLVSWPSRSPDLNPLENLWALFKRHLLRFPVPPNLRQTRELVERELPNFEREHIKLFPKLYESLPKRMNMVVKSKGLPTKY